MGGFYKSYNRHHITESKYHQLKSRPRGVKQSQQYPTISLSLSLHRAVATQRPESEDGVCAH